MAYVSPNFQTKTALRRALRDGQPVRVILGPMDQPGTTASVEGPHYPQPHAWWAHVATDQTGRVTRVLR